MTPKFKLSFDIDNAAFWGDPSTEIATSFRGEQQERPWFAGRPSQKWNHYPKMRKR